MDEPVFWGGLAQADLMSLDPASSHAIAAAAKSGARLSGLGIALCWNGVSEKIGRLNQEKGW